MTKVQEKVVEAIPSFKLWNSGEHGWPRLMFLESEQMIASMEQLRGYQNRAVVAASHGVGDRINFKMDTCIPPQMFARSGGSPPSLNRDSSLEAWQG